MLELRVDIKGEKVIIEGLQRLRSGIDQAIRRGVTRSAQGIFNHAYDWLSGAGGIYETRVSKKTGKEYRRKVASILPGQYPVPVRTGHLRRMLNWLKPGESKRAGGQTITAGYLEAIVYNAAAYSETIHEGLNTSSRYGPRRYLIDAMNKFNHGNRLTNIIEEEIQKTIGESGLG